jgi:Mn-dependent DtxR family transcriptional regulator
MMCKLKQQGFVKRERYGTVFFTSKGLKVAKEVMHNHRIIELLLTKILGYDIDLEKKQLHEEAHRLEHAFSKESLHRIDKFLNNPKIMPTGKNIPH